MLASFRHDRHTREFTYRIASLIALIGLWWLLSYYINSEHIIRGASALPSPVSVINAIAGLSVFLAPGTPTTLANGIAALWQNTLVSAERLLGGVLLGAALGIAVGLLLAWSKIVRLLVQGPVLLVRTIPLMALVPLFLAWWGGTTFGILAFIAFAVFSVVVISTVEAAGNVPPELVNVARTLGAARFRIYRTVVLPAIVPAVIGGLRVVIGIGWALLLAGEYLGAQSGLGHVLIMAEDYLYTARMALIVVMIMIYTFVLDRLFTLAADWITRWMPKD